MQRPRDDRGGTFAKAEDLIRIGAYKPGTDAVLDKVKASGTMEKPPIREAIRHDWRNILRGIGLKDEVIVTSMCVGVAVASGSGRSVRGEKVSRSRS